MGTFGRVERGEKGRKGGRRGEEKKKEKREERRKRRERKEKCDYFQPHLSNKCIVSCQNNFMNTSGGIRSCDCSNVQTTSGSIADNHVIS